MLTTMIRWGRILVVCVMLGVWSTPAVLADGHATRLTRTTEQVSAHQAESHDDPVAGVAILTGAVALLIFLAWVAVRIGDADHPADKIPN